MSAPVTCDSVRADLSARLDGEAVELDDLAVARHTAGCARCAAFDARARQVRRALRIAPVAAGEGGDELAAAVRGRLGARAHPSGGPRRPRVRALAPVAAALLVGATLGALLVSGDGTSERVAVAADLPEEILAAQHEVAGLRARVEVREHHWHHDVPLRTFDGTLRYVAPDQLSLDLRDTTAYPDDRWARNDLRLVADGTTRWVQGLRDCPPPSQPACTPRSPRTSVTWGSVPFAPSGPVPLDLVVPSAALGTSAAPPSLGTRTIDGRPAVGVAVTAAQLDELLGGLRVAGNLREVHPSDEVALWLDRDALVPLEVVVRASDAPGRGEWATERGASEVAGDLVLELRLRDVAVHRDGADDPIVVPDTPEGAVTRDDGFVTGAPIAPDGLRVPGTSGGPPLPAGLRAHRSGTVGDRTTVWSWVDGRAWMTLTATTSRTGDRPSGGIDPLAPEVRLPGGGVALADAAAGRVLVHGAGIDLVLAGTVGTDSLLDVAAGLGVRGERVEVAGLERMTPADVATAVGAPILLLAELDGRPDAALALDRRGTVPVVRARWTGAGTRTVSLTAWATDALGPPLDADVVATDVRGHPARMSTARGELSWVEDGIAYRLRSDTVPIDELGARAESMVRTP